MVLRKKTIDNRLRFIPKSEQTRKKIIEPNTKKILQIPENKIKMFHKTIKISLKVFQYKDSSILNE